MIEKIPFFNEADRAIMAEVREMVKAWGKKDTRRWIVTSEEYAERLRKGLPMNVITLDEVKQKYWGRR